MIRVRTPVHVRFYKADIKKISVFLKDNTRGQG